MKKHSRQIILVILILVVIIGLRFSGLGDYLTLENLKRNADRLYQYANQNYLRSVIAYIAIYIIVAGFSVPGATILTLAGGFLYGVIGGALYVNLGATAGATFAFVFARYLAGASVQRKYADKLEKFNTELAENGFRYLLGLRLIPIFPFFMINIFAGLTNIPLRTFIWTTSVGILPGSVVYAYAGRQLGTIESMEDIFSVKVLAAFGLLALFAIFPAFLKHFKSKKLHQKQARIF